MNLLLYDSVPLTYAGGYEEFIVRLASEAENIGHSVEVVTGPAWFAKGIGYPLGLRVRRKVPESTLRARLPNVRLTNGGISSIRGAFARADVIYAKNEPHELVFTTGVNRRRVPIVVGLHSTMLGREGLRGRIRSLPYRSSLYSRLLRRASLVHALTTHQRDFVVGRLRVPASRILVVPNGVDLDRYACRDEDLRRDRFSVLFVGRLDKGKGIDVLIEAAISLDRSGEKGIEFKIAGDGPLRKDVEMAAIHHKSVVYLGHVGDPTVLYSSSSLLAAPSRFESAPLSPAEALAASLPLVASRIPAHEPYSLPEHAILVRPGDPPALASAILVWYERWRSNSKSYELARKSARSLATERFDGRQNLRVLITNCEALCQ